MNPKILFGFALAMFFVVAEVSGRSCTGCGFGRGADYCASCNPGFVRSVSVKSPRAKCPAKAIGDVCSCTDVEVKPVSVPRPKSVYKAKKRVVSDPRPLIPAPDHLHDFSQDPADDLDTSYLAQSCGEGPLYPVDAVSMSLVSRLQDSYAASPAEERLAYGFYTAPQEALVVSGGPHVAEEKLQAVERPVVELRGPQLAATCGTGCGQEEIVMDANMQQLPLLSYTDLGYVPEEVKQPKFITSCQRKGRKEHQQPCSCEDSSEEDYKYVVRSKKTKPCSA